MAVDWKEVYRRRNTPEYRIAERKRINEYYLAHPEKKKESWRKFNEKHGIKRRSSARIKAAVKAVEKHGTYSPRPNRRLPSWCPVGCNPIDINSTFLEENITESHKDFAREISIERKIHDKGS